MWLFNSKPSKSDYEMIEQTIYDAIVSGAKTTENVDESRKLVFDSLKDRVKAVNTITTKLETLNEEQNVTQHDFIVNTVHIDYDKISSPCDNSKNTKSICENNEKSLQTLTAQMNQICDMQKIHEEMLRQYIAKTESNMFRFRKSINRLDNKLSKIANQHIFNSKEKELIYTKSVNNDSNIYDSNLSKGTKNTKKKKDSNKGKIGIKKSTQSKKKQKNPKNEKKEPKLKSVELNKSVNESDIGRNETNMNENSSIEQNNNTKKIIPLMEDYFAKLDSMLTCFKKSEENERLKFIGSICDKLECKINTKLDMVDNEIQTLIFHLEKITSILYTNELQKPKNEKCEKCFCDYLHNQPTPEWIKSTKHDENINKSLNCCQKPTIKTSTDDTLSSICEVYNIEKMVDGGRPNDDILYRITVMDQTEVTDKNANSIDNSCSDKLFDSINDSQETNT